MTRKKRRNKAVPGGKPRSTGGGRRGHPKSRVRIIDHLASAVDGLLHPQPSEAPLWRYLWPVLALAFAVRAAVALSGDFIVHPDEIMQYLEPAHRLAFGNGIVYWEFFYGARSWLLPGFIAGVLKAFDVVGLGQPFWYVGGVKLVFCLVSLGIPAGMYFFARRHFGETEARVALLAGAFWYELIVFAHKPLTAAVATALIMALLALVMAPRLVPGNGRDATDEGGFRVPWRIWLIALLALFATAIRWPYAPLVLALLGLCFLRVDNVAKVHLTVASVVLLSGVGVFEAVTWDAGLFHSYLTYIRFTLELRQTEFAGAVPGHQYLWWLLLASTGGGVLCVVAALGQPRRYGLLLLLGALVLIAHSTQLHKEYRYVFAVIPLWLLLGSGLVTQLVAWTRRPIVAYAAAGTVFAVASLAGILNALPWQQGIYRGPHQPKETVVRFLHGQDPHFAAFRYLAEAPDVAAIWHPTRFYHSLPGYYYLHRRIPFYDAATGPRNNIHGDLQTLQTSVSHLITEDPALEVPGYVVEKEFGHVRILAREANEAPVRQWQSYRPTLADDITDGLVRPGNPDAPHPLPNQGIRFVE